MIKTGSRLTLAASTLVLALGCASGAPESVDAGDPPDAAPEPDAAPDAAGEICAKDPCSILDQCGCDAPQVCDIDLDNQPTAGTECRDVTAPGTELATCANLSQCAGGYVCLGDGQCRQYCDDDDDCGPTGFCAINLRFDDGNGNFMDVPGTVMCTKECTPEAASGANNCPDGYGCDVFVRNPGAADEFFHTDCRSAPAIGGLDGADCSTNGSRDCAPGHTCVIFSDAGGNELSRECKQTCDVGNAVCGAGACQSFSTPLSVNGNEYGFCD